MATQTALLAAARPLFAERGFNAVSADEIVRGAGVTRGALHHHYGDKRGLFRAVFEQVEEEIVQEIADVIAAGQGDLFPRALTAFLDITERTEVRQIAMTDAPAVLGWQTWRELEAQYGLGLLITMVEASPVVDSTRPAPMLAQIVLSAVVEGALLIAYADDAAATRAKVESSLLALFGDLLPE
ncbi:TetR/AcrR family transcriptional regulator [Aeromicrobium panaciterrae]|uniref:TetR/AcrR family transcriptional regulator n=1 Tax=Aeromicrobium panaciterrae TaxID=363861 RepID=UPI0031DB6CC0